MQKEVQFSFTWRSILDARLVIERGVRWRIGDGRKVRAWKDPWIPRLHYFRPFTPQHIFMPDITVAELMNTTGWDWNLNILEALFCVEDVDMIKSIPLGNYALEDSRLEHDDFNLFVMIYWQLWGRRNKRTMENIDFHPGECVVSAINILRDFYNVVSTKPSLSPSAHRWSVPEVETVKINFDASILRNREGAGLGAIARDHSGRCIAWRMAFVPNVANPELGEAARLAIEIWRRFQWHNRIIEGDCIQIVHKLNSKETDY
ncbi:UNVERIFIED_CONTAM: hypothetical protein Sradi_1310400 [Sesamum radiatum]|uniref:RNase H type-1 domain-containing protein n=1 Tax=Sesamum radiatum TaxID=300843 RepID=A0AAW2UPL7_SESRA